PVLILANQIKTVRDNNVSLYSLKPPRLASEALALDYYTTFFDCQHLDEIMMICKSNDQVQQWNRRIREKLGFGHFSLCVGDVVMLRSAWMEANHQLVNGNMGVIASLSDNTEEIAGLRFKDAEIIFKNGEEKIRINTKVLLDSLDNATAKVDTGSIKYLKNHRMAKNTVYRASQRAKDDPYMYAMKLSYGYALTGNKAQGSEWKRVLFTPDKLHSTDHAWMYTAVTRARNEVFSWWFNK
ncbi:MAG: ATP-binding domain-containing protein, partial [Leadbetterella sp.]|nr:ATP-binding domain-containing protein [Leadbetterella sp.]